MACRGLAVLLVALASGGVVAETTVSGVVPSEAAIAGEQRVPWADLRARAVLRVDQVADLNALFGVQAVLRERSGGQLRLLAVGRSEAWFVADTLPTGGWPALLAQEARLSPPAIMEAPEDLHAVRLWTPVPLQVEPAEFPLPR